MISNLFEKYIPKTNEDANGLFLLDLPTGFGKTHSIMEFIYKSYTTHKKNIIFLTNLKKNLDKNSLKSFFEKDDKLDEYEKDVVFLDSNSDAVIETLEKIKYKIPSFISNLEEYKTLEKQVIEYKKIEKQKNQGAFLEFTKNQIREKHEPIFRHKLIAHLKDKFANKNERLEAIKTKTDYQWISELYPAVLTDEKRIFFMSINKFLVKNTPIISSSYSFIDDKFLNNSIIIIDEFDASKDVILEFIIKQQLEYRISLINLFGQIYSSFFSLDLPEVYYEESEESKKRNKWRKENSKNSDTTKEIIEKIIKETEKLQKKYNFNYSFKTIDLERKRAFLFHDESYSTITGDKEKKYIHLKNDNDKKINQIIVSEEKTLENPTIIGFISELRGFINYFKSSSKIIAENYQYLVNEERKASNNEETYFSYENALNTFFNALKISQENREYLVNSILNEGILKEPSKKEKFAKDFENLTIYEKGFRYYEFEDSENHNTNSHIYSTDFDKTPEKLLLDISLTNFVVGLSATATTETVLGNYDLSYLRRHLREKLITTSKEEQGRLRATFEERYNNYVSINIDFIKNNDDFELELEELGLEAKVLSTMFMRLNNQENYIKERYIRIAKAYQKFIEHSDIKSFLCFLTILPKANQDTCDENILKELFTSIAKKHEYSEEVEDSYVILASKNFDEDKETILKKLSEGKRIFVITTYKTLGAGQNMQYSIPETLKVGKDIKKVFTRDKNDKFQKDFDAIYLDKPTNLAVNINEELNEEQKAKRIFHLEMLYESDKINRNQLKQEAKKTLRSDEQYKASDVKFSALTDFREFLIKEAVQAIGRISRTTYKNNIVHVFADEQIIPFIKNIDVEEKLHLKEFEALVKRAKLMTAKEEVEEDNFYVNQTKRTMFEAKKWIDGKIARQFRQKNDMQEWQLLRETVLKYPTISLEDFKAGHPFSACQFAYIPMSKEGEISKRSNYYFKQKEGSAEYGNLEISTTKKVGFKKISDEDVRLNDLMQIPSIKHMFEENNYSTSFEKNNYIISPIIFNNIYKGALGEIVGKYILENGILPKDSLKELSENIFEKFDYVYNQNIFIDFKFWSEKHGQNSKEQTEKIRRKIELIEKQDLEVKKVLIINIFANTTNKIVESIDRRIIEIPFLIEEENKSYKISQNLSKLKEEHFIH